MKSLYVDVELLYYDFPQVFIGRDAVAARYICMVIEDEEDGPIFACVPASAYRVRKLVCGQIDLRQAYEEPEILEVFNAQFTGEADAKLEMLPAQYDLLPQEMLPEAGLVFDAIDEVAQEAAELNTTISSVSLEVPEASGSARIKSTTLAGFLNLFESVVRNVGRSLARAARKPLKRDDDSFSADVFGFARGSFTIKFRSSHESDMFGENPAFSAAMSQLANFLALAEKPEQAVAFLQSVKGHTASSLIRMMSFLAEHSAAIKLEWATPSMAKAERSSIGLPALKNLVEICRQRSDLSIEIVGIKGRLSKVDVEAATWKIFSEAERETYSGEVAPESGIKLSGLITTDALYEFICQEVIEVVPATGQEMRTLFLQKIERIE